MEAAVYRTRNSHCCLVVTGDDLSVTYISTEEGNGELKTDVSRVAADEFHSEFKLLANYPVRRAVEHYLNPITSAIAISDRAAKVLNKMSTDTNIAAADLKKLSLSERNIEATRKAGIKNTGTSPEVAPVAVVELIPGSTKKPKRGTWDMKTSPTEDNREATKQAVRHHNEAKAKAAKKAAQKAARLESKKMTEATATTETTDAPAQQKPVAKTPAAKKAPAKKAAAKKPEAKKASVEKPAASKPAASPKPAAKKAAAKKTTTAPAEKASKEKTVKNDTAKKTAAKKTTKAAPAKKAAAKKAPAKKLAKGTGKGKAAPAKKQNAKAAAADGARRGRKSSFEEGQKIKVLVKDNPKREGTSAYDTFEQLKKSKTVGDFFANGGSSASLHWNIERGYIEIN